MEAQSGATNAFCANFVETWGLKSGIASQKQFLMYGKLSISYHKESPNFNFNSVNLDMVTRQKPLIFNSFLVSDNLGVQREKKVGLPPPPPLDAGQRFGPFQQIEWAKRTSKIITESGQLWDIE